MLYSFDYLKLDQRNHDFLVGDVYVYIGNVYPKHISKVTFSCNQTINSYYHDHLNPRNCRLATDEEIDMLKKSNKTYILV